MPTIGELRRQFDALDTKDFNYKQTGASQQDKDKFSKKIYAKKEAIIKQIVALEKKQAVNNSKPIKQAVNNNKPIKQAVNNSKPKNKGGMFKRMGEFRRGAGKMFNKTLGNRNPRHPRYKL